MTKYMAVLECDIFTYEVKAFIDEDGANIIDIYFGGEPLNNIQKQHFINIYGETDLEKEVMDQFRRECVANDADQAGEDWEIRQLEGRG